MQDKETQDSANFEQLCTRHNELMLKLEQRNSEIDELKEKIIALERFVHSNHGQPTNNLNKNAKDKTPETMAGRTGAGPSI